MVNQDFSKSIIYHFRNKDTKVVIYVGSTTNYKGRRNTYKCHHHSAKYTQYLSPLNKHIRANGGWDMYEMVAVQSLNLNSKEDLLVAEQAEIDKYTTLLNSYDAVQNPDKHKEQIKQGHLKKKDKVPTAVKENEKGDKNTPHLRNDAEIKQVLQSPCKDEYVRVQQ
jgi:hypothetical protein